MVRYSKQILAGISCLLMLCIAGTFSRGDSTVATGTITGTVTGMNGATSGVTIKVFPYHGKHSKGSSTSTTSKHEKPVEVGDPATTDANGNFSIANIPPGEYLVTATLKGVGKGKATANLTGTTIAVSITLKGHKAKSK